MLNVYLLMCIGSDAMQDIRISIFPYQCLTLPQTCLPLKLVSECRCAEHAAYMSPFFNAHMSEFGDFFLNKFCQFCLDWNLWFINFTKFVGTSFQISRGQKSDHWQAVESFYKNGIMVGNNRKKMFIKKRTGIRVVSSTITDRDYSSDLFVLFLVDHLHHY